jgi:hypothetical protein
MFLETINVLCERRVLESKGEKATCSKLGTCTETDKRASSTFRFGGHMLQLVMSSFSEPKEDSMRIPYGFLESTYLFGASFFKSLTNPDNISYITMPRQRA